MLGTPYFLVDLLDGEVERDDLVADKKLHPSVVLQQRHQLTVYKERVRKLTK